MKHARARRPGGFIRRSLKAAIAVATVLVLTACGARIDTTMAVGNDGSGSRVMVLTLGGEDLVDLAGGAAAVDASVLKNLPAELDYSGIQSTPDGGVTLALTLSFANSGEYREKAQALLTAGGNTSASIDFSVTDSLLLKGIVIDENFSSYDLVKWMFDGLLADGVVPSASASNMYEIGDTALSYGGVLVAQNDTYDYTSVDDKGFTGVSMTTDISDLDNIERTIAFTVTAAKFATNQTAYEQYFSESTPTGATVTMPSDGTWEMIFSGDPQSISVDTDTALGSTGSTFSIESGRVADDPATLTTTIVDVASCENICAADSDPVLHDSVSASVGYTPKVSDVDLSAGAPIRFENAPPIKSVDADFTIGTFGSVQAHVDFVVANSDVALVGDGFAQLLTPRKGVGTLTSKKGSDETTYTAVIKADNFSAFASAYAKWAPGSSASATQSGDSNFFSHDVAYSIDPGLGAVVKGHEISGTTTTSIGLPFGQQMTSANETLKASTGITGTTVTADGPDSRMSFQAGGPTLAGLLLIGSFVLAVVSALILLVKYRRDVKIKILAARTRVTEFRKPSGLEVLSAGQWRPFSAVRSTEGLFGFVSVGRPRPVNRSMLAWQQPFRLPVPSASLLNFAHSDAHRVTVKTMSLFVWPAAIKPVPRGGHLLDQHDAFGTSRPRVTTN